MRMTRLHQSIVSGMDHSIGGGNIGGGGESHHFRQPAASTLSFGAATGGGSRPGLSFPLGTGLVVLIILFVSALFSFCYHWLSLKKRRRTSSSSSSSSRPQQHEAGAEAAECKEPPTITKLDMVACPPVVYMAGDYIPRFIAVPRPLAVDAPLPVTPGAAQDIHDADNKALPSDALKLDVGI